MKKASGLLALACAAGIALSTIVAASASAREDLHPEIQAMLDDVPGGIALDYDEAYWPELDMTMTTSSPLVRAVGTCATGSVCAFAGSGLTGTKLAWGTCTVNYVPAGFVTLSIANARAPGSVAQARNGSTILTSASAGGWTNVSGSVTNLRCLE